jgi:hypothetical protein
MHKKRSHSTPEKKTMYNLLLDPGYFDDVRW